MDNTIFGGEHVKLLKMVTNIRQSASNFLSFEFLQNEFVDLNVKEFENIKIAISLELKSFCRFISQYEYLNYFTLATILGGWCRIFFSSDAKRQGGTGPCLVNYFQVVDPFVHII